MARCSQCGFETESSFRFCPQCGNHLVAPPSVGERRKVVTILFCDVVESTALGEQFDPERVRSLLARYFERMKSIVERHGGTVDKFIGDAVEAVFGLPQVHEDDALRACRAAVEMREAVPGLGLQARVGVNTGEVVTGTKERLVTGDAVNVAARLEQAAQPGEVLLGEETLRRTRAMVQVEGVGPLALKGKSEPVHAFRLLSLDPGGVLRRSDGILVGREPELAWLRDAFAQVVRDGSCRLLTVLGDAGVGKSRLITGFLASLERSTVVHGRCLPYGDGITYWSVVEVVKQLPDPRSLHLDKAAVDTLADLVDTQVRASTREDIAWAFRKLLEAVASRQQPLVCAFDDVQWGEEGFLDLVEQFGYLSRGAPIMLMCIARPELLDRRPSWPTSLRLQPLDNEQSARLLSQRLGQQAVRHELRERILEAAGGNPLFLQEIVALALESKTDDLVVPPTIQALLAARLDQLDAAERTVLERAAVEGEICHRGAVWALTANEPRLTTQLTALVHKELIYPVEPQIGGEDAYRFRHILLRDAAYDALPKATRADLHERFAAWLEQHGTDLVSLDELLGYHLELAAHYRYELGHADPSLAERAGAQLAVAGRRAIGRGDERAAAGLLERALKLIRPIRLDVVLELDLAHTLSEQDGAAAAAIADSAAERARASCDETSELLARVGAAFQRVFVEADPAVDELERLALKALPLLEQAEDHAGLVHVWFALGMGVANSRARFEDWADAAEQAIRHNRLAGRGSASLFGLAAALVSGPRPADQALHTLDALLPENAHPRVLVTRAWLLTMLARFDEAVPIARAADAHYRDLTGGDPLHDLGPIAATAGRHEEAVVHLRSYCDLLETRGLRSYLSTYAQELGRSLCALGRHDEAEPLARLGRDLGDEKDVWTQTRWRQVQALVHADRGEHDEAEQLARRAIVISKRTDALNLQGDALCDLAEVLNAAGRSDEAQAGLAQALDRYERKHNVAQAEQVRERLAELQHMASR